jgi:NAD(P)-dependent dehydrogenase (short-subunit alcohol dehydrogenase family)
MSNRKVVLITGTSSGFGWLAAQTCAANGYQVYATMRDIRGRNAEKANVLRTQPNIEVLEMDVTDSVLVKNAVSTVLKKEGKIDVVVNNAGVYSVGVTETFTDDDLERILNVDVIGPWRMIRAVLPYMRQNGNGLIINVSSVAGRFSFPFQSVYNAAKFALEGLTEGLHYEVRPLGVDVVILQPGPFPTEIFKNIMTGTDGTIADEYGALASVPDQIGAGVQNMFNVVKPNPQSVADAILKIINSVKGKRPLRTVVDPAGGAFSEAANAHVKQQFDQFMTAFGMKELLK